MRPLRDTRVPLAQACANRDRRAARNDTRRRDSGAASFA